MKKKLISILSTLTLMLNTCLPIEAIAATAYQGPTCTLVAVGDSCSIGVGLNTSALSISFDSNFNGVAELNGVLNSGAAVTNIPLFSLDGKTEYSSGVSTPGVYLANIASTQSATIVLTSSSTATSVSLSSSNGVGKVAIATGSSGTVTSVSGTALEIAVANGTTTPVISIVSNPTIPGLTASQCVTTNGSGQLVSTGAACSSTSGTVTSVSSGTSGVLSVANPTTTPVISVVNTPSFAGLGVVTADNFLDSGLTASQCVGTNGSKQLVSNTNCVTTATTYSAGTGLSLTGTTFANTGILSNTGTTNQITASTTSGATTFTIPSTFTAPGSITSTTNIIDGGITTGQCVQTSTAGLLVGTGSACSTGTGTVTSVTSGTAGFLSVATGTTTPVISVASSPSLAGSGTLTTDNLIDSGLTAGQSVGTNASKQLITEGFTNQIGVQSFTTPSQQGSVTITTNVPVTLSANSTVGLTAIGGTPRCNAIVTNSGVSNSTSVALTNVICTTASGSTFSAGVIYAGSATNQPLYLSGTLNQILDTGPSTFGASVLSLSPTLIAPGTFEATTSIQDDGLTASQCVGTNGSKILVSNTNCVTSIANPVTATAPTEQTFLSGSGTYTTPSGVQWIEVTAVGGAGGGGGSGTAGGTAGNGGNTTFGTSLIVANGGTGGQDNSANGPAGGSASLGTALGLALTGGSGGVDTVGLLANGGQGGSSCLGGAGSGSGGTGSGATGTAGATNSGSGGGGAGSSSVGNLFGGAGGGSGGCVMAHINAPSATYAYAVGAAGTAGTAGTGGNAGGAGGSGGIWVTEHFNY